MPALPPDRPGCPKAPGGRRPLPDLAAVRLYLVPDPAPPYDEEVRAGEPGKPEPGQAERGWMEPGHGIGRGERASTEGRDGRPPHDGIRGAPRPPAAATGTPPGWPDRFAQVLAEALAGSRPPRQLVPWATEEALDRIQRLGPRLASAQRPLVRRVVTSRPAADVL